MAAQQAPPSVGFSRQEHWSGLLFPSPIQESEKWKWSRSVVSNSVRPHGLQLARLFHPWNFQDKSTGVGSVQFSLVTQSCPTVTPWIAAHQASLSITNSQSLLKLTFIESVMPSSHLILCRPLLLLPPNSPSIRVFSNESTLHMRWPTYSSFCFNISPSNEHPGLITFREISFRLVGSPCSPRDSREAYPTPQFKSINFSALNFLHSPTLTSIHDHWKNHSLDQTDVCWQSNVSAL